MQPLCLGLEQSPLLHVLCQLPQPRQHAVHVAFVCKGNHYALTKFSFAACLLENSSCRAGEPERAGRSASDLPPSTGPFFGA